MLNEGALAISIPAPEWKSTRPPGSVFFRRHIAAAPFSKPLVRALDLVFSASSYAGFEPVFVARPEIFTHGESLAWLKAKLGPVGDHLSFSDGATIKLIPGLRNHVFFFGLGRRGDGEALERLERRFPELFAALHGQVNSALRLGSSGDGAAPIAIQGARCAATMAAYYPIALDAHSADDSLKLTLRAGPLAFLPRGFDELTYVPLTEASLGDRGFARSIASLYDAVYFAPARALVLGAPETVAASSEPQDRIKASLAALGAGGARAPLAPARNAWLAIGEAAPASLSEAAGAADFLAHDTFDLWRLSPGEYRLFRSRRVIARRSRNLSGDFDLLIEALCGAGVEILWRDDESESA